MNLHIIRRLMPLPCLCDGSSIWWKHCIPSYHIPSLQHLVKIPDLAAEVAALAEQGAPLSALLSALLPALAAARPSISS